jgi:hypothetical protein
MAAFDPLRSLAGRSTIAAVIALVRQYLPTLIVLSAGLFWGAPLPLIVAGVLVSGCADFFLIGPVTELALYRPGLDLDAPVPRQVDARQIIHLHLLAICVSAALVLVPYILKADAVVQQGFGMAAILVGSSASSYCGLLMYPLPSTPRDLLTNIDVMPYQLFLLDLLPTAARRMLQVLLRISLGLAAMLPFVALSGFIHREPFRAPMMLIVPALAAFFQLGFVTWLAGLFLLRWRGSRGREIELPS